MTDQQDPSLATERWIEVKIQGLRSEMRLLFVLSVAGNQLLGHLTLPSTAGFIASGALLFGALAVKVIGVMH